MTIDKRNINPRTMEPYQEGETSIFLHDRDTWPRIGSQWIHRNGNTYVVVGFTNTESTRQEKYPTTVVYRNDHTGATYSRSLMDWERSFTRLGRMAYDVMQDLAWEAHKRGEV